MVKRANRKNDPLATTPTALPASVPLPDQGGSRASGSTQAFSGAITVNGFCDRYNIGRTTFYAEVKAGRIRLVKMGRKTLIPEPEGERWLASLPTADATSIQDLDVSHD
jgi:excisionase family DNA binding protein